MGGFSIRVAALALVSCAAWSFAAWQACVMDWRVLFRAVRSGWLQIDEAGRGVAAALGRRLGIAGRPGPEAPSLGEVTEMLDVIRLGLSAGLSFDAALGLFCVERAGPLSEAMERARISWQMGVSSREDALMEVAHRFGVRALEPFATATSQALALGAPLADTLAGQVRECRAAHRADVERQIERAPVKLLIPTGTLILPALLLSILGPLLAAGGMI